MMNPQAICRHPFDLLAREFARLAVLDFVWVHASHVNSNGEVVKILFTRDWMNSEPYTQSRTTSLGVFTTRMKLDNSSTANRTNSPVNEWNSWANLRTVRNSSDKNTKTLTRNFSSNSAISLCNYSSIWHLCKRNKGSIEEKWVSHYLVSK